MPARHKPVNINLIIKDELGESFSGQLLKWALTYGRYTIIITQIIVLSVFFLRFKLDRDHTDLKESVAQKQAIVESVTDLEVEIRRVQDRLANIKKLSQNQEVPLNVILFFQDQSPSDTLFDSFNLNGNKLAFSASVANLRSFSFFMNVLQENKSFSEVTLSEISRRPNGRVEFKIDTKINPIQFQ
ncbi:hypothetical protein HYW55_04875 [Candidatus Gottesmanbacteria bacterium]|nr:hypothetical protein [Candidatus Gottesmanbacteria bacterium]